MKPKKILVLACSLAVLATFVAVASIPLAAQGERPQLKGNYSFNGEQACLASSLGFNPNLTPVAGSTVTVQSASTQGVMTFNADGTGAGTFTELIIVHPPASPLFAASQDASFTFTYTIGEDGAVTIVAGVISGTFVTGPLTGITLTNNPPPLSGHIAKNGEAIPVATMDPIVETLNLGTPLNSSLPRICHRARTLVPIHVDGRQ